MALVGFPEYVQVTLGPGWAPGAPWGLTPGTVLELQWNAIGAAYTESGTAAADGVNNRLHLFPTNNAATWSTNRAALLAVSSPAGTAWLPLGYSDTPTTSLADYTWNSVWTRLPTYYITNGFNAGFTQGFMTGPNQCYEPEVFSSFDQSSEGNWWQAQQALLNLALFPNCIQVTLGAAWGPGVNGLTPATVMQLHRVPGLVPPMWTEDGSATPDPATNRLSWRPNGTPGNCSARLFACTATTAWLTVGFRVVSAAGYSFHTIWDMATAAESWTGGFVTPTTGMGTTGIEYNDEIFAAIDPCGAGGGGDSPDLFACQRAP